LSRLTGTNKAYIDSRIPHLAKLMVNNPADLIQTSDVIVVTTNEKEFSTVLNQVHDKKIVDLVRLPDEIRKKSNYYGINW
jgi:GDP-mannose 6-dehydrogenase